jgi:hypothetical protein
MRRTLLVILVGVAGLALAVGITFAANELTSQSIGLESEPLEVGTDLVPAPTTARTGDGRPRKRTPAARTSTTTTASPPAQTTAASPPAQTTAAPPAAQPSESDDDSGGKGRGRGRGRGGDDDGAEHEDD